SGPTVSPSETDSASPRSGNSVSAPAVVIRPILGAPSSVNHRLPSGALTIAVGKVPAASGNSVTAPAVVTFAMRSGFDAVSHRLPPRSVNQMLPSGPPVISPRVFPEFGSLNSAKAPDVVTRPIAAAPFSVNQRLPSGPVVIATGSAVVLGIANSVTPADDVDTR